MTTDYVKRKSAKIYEADEESLYTYEILQKNYPYIYDAMKKESFKLESPKCEFFEELLYNGKVVGFATQDFHPETLQIYINAVYVLPDFRGRGIFKEYLDDEFMIDSKIAIYQPNHLLIDLLIKYGYVEQVEDDIVVSMIDFYVSSANLSSNDLRYPPEQFKVYTSNIYDLEISSLIVTDDKLTSDKNVIFYSQLMDDDKNNYDGFSKRQKVGKKYFRNIISTLDDNKEYINYVKNEYKEDEISDDSINEKMEEDIGLLLNRTKALLFYENDGVITTQQRDSISEQVIEEYLSGQVLKEGLETRVEYLVKTVNDPEPTEEDVIKKISGKGFVCPYCHEEINRYAEYCPICGFNHHYNPMLTPDLDDNWGDEDVELTEYDTLDELLTSVEEMDDPNDIPFYLNQSEADMFREIIGGIAELSQDSQIPEMYGSMGLFGGVKPPKMSLDDYEFESCSHEDSLTILIYKTLSKINDYTSFDSACERVSNTENVDCDELKEEMVSQGYVENRVDEDNWFEVGNALKVPDLKDILRQNKQKVSGSKNELIERIAENVPFENITTNPIYKVTEKGRNLASNDYYYYFINFMGEYDLEDYLGACGEVKADAYSNTITYLRLYELKAFYDKKSYHLVNHLSVISAIMKANFHEEDLLRNDLKLFLASINPVNVTSMEKNFYQMLRPDNVFEIKKLVRDLEVDLDEVYDKVYNNFYFDEMIFSKDDGLKILKKAMITYDIDYLGSLLMYNYFVD